MKTNNKSVLVIDDENIVRLSCKRVLETEGYIVKLASRADEALNILYNEKIDVVITDIKMPDIDGFEVLRIIQDNKG